MTMSYAPVERYPVQRYPVCDSYFVEEVDANAGVYVQARAQLERTKAYNRTRQRGIARDMSVVAANDYELDILQHMERMESETMPDVHSIEVQTEIQWFMRPYLLDFLLEAHQAFQLLPETFFLAINILDRYCSRRVVYKRHYQLVGCAALLIAAKYGDRKERVPTIRELKSMCCSLYDEDMFTQMEWHVLQTLNWLIGHPTVSSFLEIALFELPQTPHPVVEHMALYLSEIALYHKDLLAVKPSVMARSSLALAKFVLGITSSRTAEWCSIHDTEVILELSKHLAQPSQGVYRKYADQAFSSVSEILEHFVQQQNRLAGGVQAMTPTPERLPASDDYMHPQTPQKLITAGSQDNLMTPPYTPNESFAPVGCWNALNSWPAQSHSGNGMSPTSSAHSNQPFSQPSYGL